MKKIPVRQISPAHRGSPSSERFKIRLVKDILDGKDIQQDLHRHDFFFVLAVKNGKGTHEIDFIPYKILNDSVFILRPGQVHRLELKAGSTGFLMEFSTEFYHPKDKQAAQRLRRASNRSYCRLESNRFKKLYAALENMFQESLAKEEGYPAVIKANLDIFFIEFVRQSANPHAPVTSITSYTQERFEEFLELLETHITSHKQVSQYAGLMNLSPYQLNEVTKATVGKTASALISEHIILEAKRHLLATPNQIKDIADQVGYEDVSYFIRFFKKQTGYSPEAFRNSFG